MKTSVVIAAIMFSVSAHAKIDVSSVISRGESTEVEATQMTSLLKGLGVKGHMRSGDEILKLNGEITVTNGAACDNGHMTYDISVNEIDEAGKTVQTIRLDGRDGCTQPSVAEKFNALLNTWGGSTLVLDCGAGHCWEKIDSIECQHYNSDKVTDEFDACTVQLSTGD